MSYSRVGFNSKLVRLKAHSSSSNRLHLALKCFNSKLVRLKAKVKPSLYVNNK